MGNVDTRPSRVESVIQHRLQQWQQMMGGGKKDTCREENRQKEGRRVEIDCRHQETRPEVGNCLTGGATMDGWMDIWMDEFSHLLCEAAPVKDFNN